MDQRYAGWRVIAFVFLTGVLSVVIITTLLLFGVAPRAVFRPGFLIQSWCEGLGIDLPNRVGVLSTVVLLWAAINAIWFGIAKAVRHHAA